MKLILLADFLSKYEISRKIDSLNDKFNSLVDKYIGNGIGASIIVLLFVIIAAVIVGKFSKKQNYSFSSILFFSLLYILGGGFMNMIKNDEIEILEDSVENVKISNNFSNTIKIKHINHRIQIYLNYIHYNKPSFYLLKS